MINMRMSKEEAKEYTSPQVGDAPKYPYGLCLSLDDDSLTKLGLSAPPAVGTQMQVTALVTVTSCSTNQTQGGEAESRCELQITDMELAESRKSVNAAAMYDKSAMKP